ncbi:NucA/NucB deoxyribonuclease domain-containing protein [Kitasatospora sp. NPDC001660]
MLAALCTVGAGSATAQQDKEVKQAAMGLKPVHNGDQAAPWPGQAPAIAAAPEACALPAEGQTTACFTVTSPNSLAPTVLAAPQSLAAGAPVPQWCIDNAFKGRLGLRTEACDITGGTYTTYRNTNGAITTTGEAKLNVINYEYSDTGLEYWGHQIELGAYSGWGDALNGTIEGTAIPSGSCTTNKSDFPAQGISPLQSWRLGEAFFTTTATAPGAIGFCKTTWQLTMQAPGYSPIQATYSYDDIRCDNATAGNPKVGCVVPWYASPVSYSRSANPSLASHVERAQASGLPGATFDAPLYRTTNDAVTNANRTQACGDAPSIAGYSCDEYPLASTYQGLTAGGTRRTFDGCNFNLPNQTGPTGVSVCMIPEGENNSQGGTMSQFYRWQRVLDRDPYRVVITA